jgi:hypothetical protein
MAGKVVYAPKRVDKFSIVGYYSGRRITMNPVEFIEWIGRIEDYLRSQAPYAGDTADVVYIGEDIGRLLAGRDLIMGIIGSDDFWEEYSEVYGDD